MCNLTVKIMVFPNYVIVTSKGLFAEAIPTQKQ